MTGQRVVRAAVGAGLTLAMVGSGLYVTTAAAAPRALTATSTYGGSTGQDYPVVIELNATKRRIVRASTVLVFTCTAGEDWSSRDRFVDVKIRKNRRFSVVWGPETQRNTDGTTTDYSGTFSGRLNKAKTKISGSWRLALTDYDAAGAVTDTCDSGAVRFSARQ